MSRFRADHTATDVSAGLFVAALLIAGLIHLILIQGMDLALPRASSGTQVMRPLELTVLQEMGPTDEKPEIADAFAPVDGVVGDGGGAPETNDITGVELIPGLGPLSALGEMLSASVSPPLSEPVGLRARVVGQLTEPVFSADPEPASEPEPRSILEPQAPEIPFPESEPPQVKAAEILASRNREITALTARAQHGSAVATSRPRRRAIGAGTRDYKYANYLEAWCRKVERVGNLNYPEEAKRRKLYGNLTLQVALRANGSVERVRVLRSSGLDLLDEAAVRIVELAAPFSPFPPAIRAETDRLDITRTWQFLSSNRLGWKR